MRWTDPNKKPPVDDDFYELSYPKYGKCRVASNRTRLTVLNSRRHEYLFAKPPVVKVEKGGFGDLIAFDLPQIFCVSDKLKQMFENARVSGIEFRQLTVVPEFPHPAKEQRYWQIAVLGWGGRIPQPIIDCGYEYLERYYESENGERPKTIECVRTYDGLSNELPHFDPQEWDGSDFFFVWPIMGTVFITRKVAKLLTEAKVKHFSVLPLKEFRLPEIGGSACNVRVLPLACYYPPTRAKEIGDPRK